MSEHEAMVFDQEVVTIPVIVGTMNYVLTEASELAACRYQNNLTDRIKMGPNGPTSMKNIADVESMLLRDCLTGDDGKHVDLKRIKDWPAKIVKSLVKKLKEISEIDEGDQESLEKQKTEIEDRIAKLDSAKNGQSDIEDS